MTSQEFQILIGLQVVILAFNAGLVVALVKTHGSDIKNLKETRDRHDREIGVVYGHAKLPREVRG